MQVRGGIGPSFAEWVGVPDKTTRDALKRLSYLLGGPQDDAEATAETDDTGPATEDDADPPRTAA